MQEDPSRKEPVLVSSISSSRHRLGPGTLGASLVSNSYKVLQGQEILQAEPGLRSRGLPETLPTAPSKGKVPLYLLLGWYLWITIHTTSYPLVSVPCGTLEVPFNHLSRWERKGFCGQPVGPFLPHTPFVGPALEAGSQPRGQLLQPHPEEPQSFLYPTPPCSVMLALLAAHRGTQPRGGGF